jgi:hypothetical protein
VTLRGISDAVAVFVLTYAVARLVGERRTASYVRGYCDGAAAVARELRR